MSVGKSESPYGGTGNYQNLGDTVAWLRAIDPRSVLDIGCGFGRWGFLCREFLEIWNGRVYRKDWQIRLVGVDACAGNLKDHHRLMYDELHGVHAEEFLATCSDRFDLVILGDVLEHFPKLTGTQVLQDCLRRAAYVLLVLPIGADWPQNALYENEHERHLAVWQEDEILRLHPLIACRYRDYLNRPYLAAVLSLEDPKGLKGTLQQLTPSISSRPVPLQMGTSETPLAAPPAEPVVAETREKLHVALVTLEYPPLFGGGIATYALHTARLLGEAGHRVSVFTRAFGEENPPPLPNVSVYHLNDAPPPEAERWEIGWLLENVQRADELSQLLARVHADHPIDVVEVTDYYHEGLFLDTSALVRADGLPVPVITHFHGPRTLVGALDGSTYPPLLNAAEELALSGCEFAKTYSPMMRDQVNTLWPGAACEFVPAAFWPPSEPVTPDTGFEFDFVYFGRLELRKGMVPLARAVQETVRRGFSPSICFIGSDTSTAPGGGSMAEWLERELRPQLGAKLHFRDAVPPAQLWSLLRKARVIVLPSLWESLGFAALEAFCSGRPVICSDQVAAAYVLDAESAQRSVVNVQDLQRFTAALIDALNASPEALNDWSRHLRAAVERACRPEAVLQATVSYYRRCMERSGSGLAARRNDGRRFGAVFAQTMKLLAAVDGAAEQKRLAAELVRLGNAWEEHQRIIASQNEAIASQTEVIARLEQERDQYLSEAKRLGEAWESQRVAIEAQKTLLRELEQRLTRGSA